MKEDLNGNNYISPGSQESSEFRRIEQVMISLNNLSFEDTNADYMANKCPSLTEFLVMCLYCTGSNIELRKHALDILANLSRKLKLKNISEKHQSLILLSIYHLIIGQQQEPEPEQMINEFEEDTSPSLSSNLVNGLSAQDRLDIIRGIEILTKLCSQNIESNEQDNFTNEKILSRFILEHNAEDKEYNYLECIIARLEQLMSIQDVLILMHCLECFYSMTLFSESLCNLIVQHSIESEVSSLNFNFSPKIVHILVNFLTVDVSHFGVQLPPQPSNKNVSSNATIPIKVCKIMPTTSNLVIQSSSNVTQATNTALVSGISPQPVNIATNKTASLLQQTLHNQHSNNTSTNPNSVSSTQSTQKVSTSNQQFNNTSKQNTHEQNAKNILCNWLITCFQAESSSELSKTQLYPYYQQIAKMNSW